MWSEGTHHWSCQLFHKRRDGEINDNISKNDEFGQSCQPFYKYCGGMITFPHMQIWCDIVWCLRESILDAGASKFHRFEDQVPDVSQIKTWELLEMIINWKKSGRHHSNLRNEWTTYIVISSKNEIYPEFQLWEASHQFEKRVNRQHGSTLSHSFFSARVPQLPNHFLFADFHWNFQSGSFQQKKVSLHFERNLSRWWWWTQATYSCCSIPGKTDNSKSAAIGWVLLGVS